jgi:hypothetical protein
MQTFFTRLYMINIHRVCFEVSRIRRSSATGMKQEAKSTPIVAVHNIKSLGSKSQEVPVAGLAACLSHLQ